jgi:antitoxin ParD1/3/4
MTISLSPELEHFVSEEVKEGRFSTPEDVVSSALQMLKAEEELRRKIRVGIEQADRGDFVEFNAETIKREGRQRLAATQRR